VDSWGFGSGGLEYSGIARIPLQRGPVYIARSNCIEIGE